jgi:hypothetical protein
MRNDLRRQQSVIDGAMVLSTSDRTSIADTPALLVACSGVPSGFGDYSGW